MILPVYPVRRAISRGLAFLLFTAAGFAEPVTLVFDPQSGPMQFAAGDLAAALTAGENTVQSRTPDQLGATGAETAVVLALESSPAVAAAVKSGAIAAPAALQAEGFSLRVAAAPAHRLWIIGHDDAGAMYGGLEVAEVVRTRGLAAVANLDRNPRMRERGIKFNIPLDVRTPSYTDAGDPAQQNIATVWDAAFWHELIDRLARDRYNLISLWSLHPFPSLVRVPEYPEVALDDVQRSTIKWDEYYSTWAVGLDAPEILQHVETLKRLTIDEKIAFWRGVMRYGRSRNVKFYIVTWNVFTNGTGGKYGITPTMDNPTTLDYFRRSVRTLIQTYPDLAGVGLTTGENMLDATAAQKEDWAFRAYGQGVLDAVAADPARKITFIHRQHEAGAEEIKKQFAPLMANPQVDFVYSFKYAEAHALSSTVQKFHESFLRTIGDEETLWTLRNDDAFYFRWGAPDFVREFINNMPEKPSRGFYYGSDQWVWARDFLSVDRDPDAPRPLELAKHWYHWMLWGRLGYDPGFSDDRIVALLAERFPHVDAAKLFAAWQDASMIYPLTTGFHWGRFDFQWYIEASKSRPEPAHTPTGFHDLNRFISLPPHPATDNVSIPAYAKAVRAGQAPAGTTPPQVAEQLDARADRALAAVSTLTAGSDDELRHTLADIRTMAHLGKYYAHKIRAATELALLRDSLERSHQAALARELNAAAFEWRTYASLALGYYRNPIWTNRVGYVDWRELYQSVLYELTTAGAARAVPSMTPTPGGTILEAEDARCDAYPVRNTVAGFTGKGYRDMAGAAGTRWIEWPFDAPAAGDYMLELRYAMRHEETGPAKLMLNGAPAGEIVLWSTGGLQTWAWDRKIVTLSAGKNKIRLYAPLGPNIDHLNVIPVEKL
jgi:hypothetical protein